MQEIYVKIYSDKVFTTEEGSPLEDYFIRNLNMDYCHTYKQVGGLIDNYVKALQKHSTK